MCPFAQTANTNKIRTIWFKRRPILETALKARKGMSNFNFIQQDLNKIHNQNSDSFSLDFFPLSCIQFLNTTRRWAALLQLLLYCQAVIQINCSRIIHDCIWNAKQVKRIKQGVCWQDSSWQGVANLSKVLFIYLFIFESIIKYEQ